MNITPEWAGIILTGILSIATTIRANRKVIEEITTGQAIAKVREEVRTEQINKIDKRLEEIEYSQKIILNGESKCKLNFTERMARIEEYQGIDRRRAK